MSKNFNEQNVRQRSPANINSYKRLATLTSGAGRLSKRRSKRRSVNPALATKASVCQHICGVSFDKRILVHFLSQIYLKVLSLYFATRIV